MVARPISGRVPSLVEDLLWGHCSFVAAVFLSSRSDALSITVEGSSTDRVASGIHKYPVTDCWPLVVEVLSLTVVDGSIGYVGKKHFFNRRSEQYRLWRSCIGRVAPFSWCLFPSFLMLPALMWIFRSLKQTRSPQCRSSNPIRCPRVRGSDVVFPGPELFLFVRYRFSIEHFRFFLLDFPWTPIVRYNFLMRHFRPFPRL